MAAAPRARTYILHSLWYGLALLQQEVVGHQVRDVLVLLGLVRAARQRLGCGEQILRALGKGRVHHKALRRPSAPPRAEAVPASPSQWPQRTRGRGRGCTKGPHLVDHFALELLHAHDGRGTLQRHAEARRRLAHRPLVGTTGLDRLHELFLGRIAQRALAPELGVARERLAIGGGEDCGRGENRDAANRGVRRGARARAAWDEG